MGIGYARISAGSVQDRLLPVELAALYRATDDIIAGPGLDATGELHPFFLGVDAYIFFTDEMGDGLQGGMAYLFFQRLNGRYKACVYFYCCRLHIGQVIK